MSSDTEEGANWVEEIQRELLKIEEMMQDTETRVAVVRPTCKIALAVKEGREIEEAIRVENRELKQQLNDQKFQLDQTEMERDILLQQVHTYLELNSSLKIRLEEQRCQTGALKNRVNADLEARVWVLEKKNEELISSNEEKEKEVDRMRSMLEQARRRKEGSEENDVLKREVRRALEDKMKAEGRLREVLMEQRKAAERPWIGWKRETGLRRSLSEGDVGRQRFECFERNVTRCEGVNNCKLCGKNSKSEGSDYTETRTKASEPQLDVLRHGLLNLTKKLECLKTHLVNSGLIKEEVQRNLKRKANKMDESSSEESQSRFKNLTNILKDTIILYAKLENLRDGKQKMIELEKREKEVQATTKMNDASSQTSESGRNFCKAIAKLKRAVSDCESGLDKGSDVTVFAAFAHASTVFILDSLMCLSVDEENDPFREEGSDESKENGGGDNNSLKIYEKARGELKIQIARLKFRIEIFENEWGR